MTRHSASPVPRIVADSPESGGQPLASLRQIERAGAAMHAIARLVGNSVRDPNAPGSVPLDNRSVAALMGGLQSLCDHINVLTDVMLASPKTRGGGTDGELGRATPTSLQ